MKPTALFYHCLFLLGNPPTVSPHAGCVVANQMVEAQMSGLWSAANEIHVGVNGGAESEAIAKHIIPAKARVTFHGLQCKNECRTVEMMLEWAKTHPGWNVLYFHAKSSSHQPGSDYYERISAPWLRMMMTDLVVNWATCIKDLETHDIACSVWLWDQGWDKSQHIPAGTFLWITSDFAAKLPSLLLRERIKQDGIDAPESRYEAEVAFGNGPRPNVKAYRQRLPF